MKKSILLIAVLAIVGAATAVAQPRAVGGRLGYGIEASYQHSIGANMVSVEFGLPGFYSIEGVATYDWINPFGTAIPWQYEGTWNWSLGVGGAVGGSWLGYGYVGAVGRVNVEYNFWSIPLQLSVDFRPMLGVGFGKNYAYFAWDAYAGAIGISARYLF